MSAGNFRYEINVPRIYIPRHRELVIGGERPLETKMRLKGFFRCVLKRSDGSVIKDTGWFPNLITNSGLLEVRDQSGWVQFLQPGSSATTPAVTDTGAIAPFGTRKASSSVARAWGAANAYVYYRWMWQFLEGEATGSWREIAIHRQVSSGNCFSRALVLDELGSPATIVKGADNVLEVYYELRNYPEASDLNTAIDISGTAYDVLSRPGKVGQTSGGVPVWNLGNREILDAPTLQVAYTGTIGASTGEPTGPITSLFGVDGCSSTVVASGKYYNDVRLQVGIDGWVATIRSLLLRTGNCYWQHQYTKTVGGGGIVKTNEQRLRLHWRLSWARL